MRQGPATVALIILVMLGAFVVATVLFAGLIWLAGATEWYA